MYVYKCIYTLAQSCAYNWGGDKIMARRQGYVGSLGPPIRSRGNAPVGGLGGLRPSEIETFLLFIK